MSHTQFRLSHKAVSLYALSLLALTLVHHIDHVLRYDHSGWPFTAEVTPFTFSLIVYPAVISLFIVRSRKYRIITASILAALLIGAHTFIETPSDQYHTWAHNSSQSAESLHHPNLLNTESPQLGQAAAALSMLLNIGVLLLPFAYWREVEFDHEPSSSS